MSKNSIIVLKSIGNALLGLFFINLGYFISSFAKIDSGKGATYEYQHGIFSIDGSHLGHAYSSGSGIKILLLFFFISLALYFWKSKKANLASSQN